MGMFGSSGSATPYVPPQHSIIAQLLNRLGENVLGVNVLGQQDRRAAFGNLQSANSEAAGLFQPVPGQMQQAPVSNDDGQDISSAFAPQMRQGAPRMRSPQEIAAGLTRLSTVPGFNMKDYKDAAEYARPDMQLGPDNIYRNKFDGSYGGQPLVGVDKGQLAVPGGPGMPEGVQNAPGAVNAAAQAAGATTSAQEQAKAGWDLVDVPMGDGSSMKLPRAIAAPLLAKAASRLMGQGGAGADAQGQGVGSGDSSGFGVTPTPAQTELAKNRALTQGKNEADISGARSAMQQVDDQTNMIAQNLHDMLGETQDPQTGKWVKSKPGMISGMSTGSGTDVIEHIPFVNQRAKDLAAKIETVRNGTSFNSLQAIKNAMAAAGDGGSGSIRMTDQTSRMLGEINGSLNQDQSGPQFEATVRRHLAQLDALNKARHELFESQYRGVRPATPGQTGPTANYKTPSAPQPGQVVKGYKFLGGNPADPKSWAKN